MIHVASPTFGTAEQEAVQAILESGMVADGPEVRDFESEFAAYCGSDHAVATANGTAALVAALEGLGIGDGDRVVTTPFSFVASSNAIRLVGADPVFADIDPETYNLDPEKTREIVREVDADAILAVHLYGLPAAMAELAEIADEEDVALVEDAAQAHGAMYQGDYVGTFGDAAAFSFYPTKNMTTGEGGMVLTDEEAVADRAASYINHGRASEDAPYAHERVGHNLRMTSMAAAIGRVQLERLPDWIAARRDNASTLTAALEEVPGVTPPAEPSGARHAYHQYTVRCSDRERVREQLEAADIGTAIYYPTPIPDLEPYAAYDPDIPVAERAAEEVLSVPVHPDLSAADVEHISDAVRNAALQVQ
ncbi:DegT/DnrJ/EryC1/StrS aminotransferase [Halorhabdus utahensis DSM 12940]|uniref:DegT/DnrJ/EryC1/StrS aminotransferase n=1 Tax=Halorhabdus utahensis (strain DSM 12940 / JCM 11049 / AX-2) TaxID=519442 RepID=C7NS57_HALUD|nr:DegT/DnrJ/EryC1/StrS family aminotransferase [Halorhabdus utahensis]ACV10664.1 DegT/DnrJ/EryC1/StrS aminotransferase [Halorhabdus utahensis DSM 12940]